MFGMVASSVVETSLRFKIYGGFPCERFFLDL